MPKKKDLPIAYDAEYYEYQTIEYQSDSDNISDIESEISEKNDQENNYNHDVEEYNNNYSFINKKLKKEDKPDLKKEEAKKEKDIEEEDYISD